jgi:hypothetical protein
MTWKRVKSGGKAPVILNLGTSVLASGTATSTLVPIGYEAEWGPRAGLDAVA